MPWIRPTLTGVGSKSSERGEMEDAGKGRGILSRKVGKMQKRLKRMGLSLVAVGLCLAFLLTAIPVCEAGPDERVVKLGLDAAFTGALASTGCPLDEGTMDYVRYINEHGGIDGIKIDMMWQDTQALVTKGILAYKKFKDAGAVAVICVSSTTAETLAERCKKDEIPYLYQADFTEGMITKPIRWVFGSMPGYGPTHAAFMKWVKGNWTKERPPRFGHLFYDHGSGWDANAASEHADELGCQFIGYEVVPLLGVIDTSTELLRLAAKNPDFIYVTASGSTMVTIMKDAERLELKEGGIKFCGASCASGETVFRAAGRKAAEGWYYTRGSPSHIETELPEMGPLFESMKRYRGKEPRDIGAYRIAGWIEAKGFIEAVRLAIERVGFENLTGRAVRDALASLKNLDMGFGYITNMSDEQPYLFGIRIYQVKDLVQYPISDFIEPPYYYKFD